MAAFFAKNSMSPSRRERFGTPLYLYSADTILDHYRRLDEALAGIDHLICYAVKANSNRAILHLLRDAGAGFDIVSGGELFRAQKAGANPAKCTFAGVGKSHEEIAYALDQGVYSFNIESEAELNYINEIASAKNQQAADCAAGESRCRSADAINTSPPVKSENKFGIALERAANVYERASKLPAVTIRGVQMHIGSQITEAGPFMAAIGKTAPLVFGVEKQICDRVLQHRRRFGDCLRIIDRQWQRRLVDIGSGRIR